MSSLPHPHHHPHPSTSASIPLGHPPEHPRGTLFYPCSTYPGGRVRGLLLDVKTMENEVILHRQFRLKTIDPAVRMTVPGRVTQAGRDPSLFLTRRSTGGHSLAKHNSLKLLPTTFPTTTKTNNNNNNYYYYYYYYY